MRYFLLIFVVPILLMSFELASEDLYGQEPLSYSGTSVYTPPKNWGFSGYSRAPKRSNLVAPPGKETIIVDQTSTVNAVRTNSIRTNVTSEASGIPESSRGSNTSNGSNSSVFSSRSTSNGLSASGSGYYNTVSSLPDAPVTPVYSSSVPPSGKSDISWDWELDAQSVSSSNRLSKFHREPRKIRSTCFQGGTALFSWLPNSGKYQSGMDQIAGSVLFAFPMSTDESAFLVSPLFEWTQLDLPYDARLLYEDKNLIKTGMTFELLRPICNSLLLDLNVDLFYSSDTHSHGTDAFRINGYGAIIWKMGPKASMVLGVAYNDVSETSVLPIGGLIWQPSDDCVIDAIFPRPKISWRLPTSLAGKDQSHYWVYLGGNWETERWMIESRSDFDSNLTHSADMKYYDLRFFGGIERKTYEGLDWAIEGGVVFDRWLKIKCPELDEYRKYEPGTAGFVRLKLLF